jgi:insertion element IS1 protein InsB
MNNLPCPRCGLSPIKKNGRTHYGKQNHACRVCGRPFVAGAHRIDEITRALAKKLRLERLSLRGICRVLEMSLTGVAVYQ